MTKSDNAIAINALVNALAKCVPLQVRIELNGKGGPKKAREFIPRMKLDLKKASEMPGEAGSKALKLCHRNIRAFLNETRATP